MVEEEILIQIIILIYMKPSKGLFFITHDVFFPS